ncbi:MAG TPA: hypothetical protein DDW87_08575 [Firmicutes bacterium]|nr:hypothetical protein [Bacillota bacterium]
MRRMTLILSLVFVLSISLFAYAQDEGGYSFSNPVERPEKITMKGLDGDEPGWFTELSLTAEEVAAVRAMNLRIAYEMPNQSEFSESVVRGLQAATEALNIDIVGLAVCENDPHVQKENMENFAALGVDYVVSQAQEVDLAAATFNPLKDAGIKLVFQANVPTGYRAGVDYVGVAATDYYEYGIQAADALAEAIGYEGKVAIIYLASVNQVSNTRDQAFVNRIKTAYPNIELVEEAGIEAPVYASAVTSALLTRHPDLDGLHVTFVEPATEALEVVRSLGRTDLKMSTVDFNSMGALDLIRGGNIVSIIVDRPYVFGQKMALMVAYDALGKELYSSTYMGPIVAVTPENIEVEWLAGFGQELPRELKKALDSR